MIDDGAGLNICTMRVILGLGYSEDDIDPSRKITIKAYDDAERTSKGVIVLPIRVGPMIENTLLQVLDLDLPYNMILGHPWIHAMKAVPSTYHQCLKYSYNGTEITIPGDQNPFQFCANLRDSPQQQVPLNSEALSSNYVDPNSLLKSIKGKMKIEDQGCGEYSMSQTFFIGKLPISPKSHGKPHLLKKEPKTIIQYQPPTTFTKWGELNKETLDEDASTWLYKDEIDIPPTRMPVEQYGKGFTIMQKKGYDGHSGLGPDKKGRLEPIIPMMRHKYLGLGFEPL